MCAFVCMCAYIHTQMQVFVSIKLHQCFLLQLETEWANHSSGYDTKTDKCFGCWPICKSTCWSGRFLFFFCGKFVSTASLRPAHLPSLQAQTAASATPAVKKHLNRPHFTINSPFVQANDPPLPRTLCNGYATEVLGFSCVCVCATRD